VTGENAKVVVIGAGAAGLAAAHTLSNRTDEVDATVLEATDRADGRMYCTEREGFHIDCGATKFLNAYRVVPKLAESLGVKLNICGHAKAALFDDMGRFWQLNRGGLFGQMQQTAKTALSFGIMTPRRLRKIGLCCVWRSSPIRTASCFRPMMTKS